MALVELFDYDTDLFTVLLPVEQSMLESEFTGQLMPLMMLELSVSITAST
jgi:hypothetical protein